MRRRRAAGLRARQPAGRARRLDGRARPHGRRPRRGAPAALRQPSLQHARARRGPRPGPAARRPTWSTCRPGRTGRRPACAAPLLLVEDDRGRVRRPGARPAAAPGAGARRRGRRAADADAQEVLRELAELRHRLNVYRGQVLELAAGTAASRSPSRCSPPTAREDVVLPEPVLRRVERHTLDVAAHRDALRAAGQHLKRGLLLYGPPGTGKTHTTRYVVQQLRGSTVLLLSGQSLHADRRWSPQLARDLQPAVVVLEDVDLVAEDRGYGPGRARCCSSCSTPWTAPPPTPTCCSCSRPTAPTCSSRRSPRGPAGSTSPSRSTLPDADARRRLFEVYTRGVPLALERRRRRRGRRAHRGRHGLVPQGAGPPRRCSSRSPTAGALASRSPREHLSRALDDLLDSTQAVTRALLGVGRPAPPPTAAGPPVVTVPPAGWRPGQPSRPPTAAASRSSTTSDQARRLIRNEPVRPAGPARVLRSTSDLGCGG